MLVPMLWVGVLLFLAWSLGSIVLAWFAWRRHNWARYLLAASAVVTLLIGVVAFPVGIPHQIACALAAGGLFAPQSRAWYAGHQGVRAPAPTLVGAQRRRSLARSRAIPSSSTSRSLQNAHRTRCRPSAEPSS